MNAVFLMFFIVGIVWVIAWSLRNDNVASIGEQVGMFSMPDYENDERTKKRKKEKPQPPAY